MKNLILFLSLSLVLVSCKKGFTTKQSGKFTANGVVYNVGENGMSASYYTSGSQYLRISSTGASGGTYQTEIVVDLTKVNSTETIANKQDGFSYIQTGANVYYPLSGQWKITSHEEGNPATRHTEGTYSMIVRNPNPPYDIINITDGYFFVNNY